MREKDPGILPKELEKDPEILPNEPKQDRRFLKNMEDTPGMLSLFFSISTSAELKATLSVVDMQLRSYEQNIGNNPFPNYLAQAAFSKRVMVLIFS